MMSEQGEDERAEEFSSIAAIFPELVVDASNRFTASIDLPVSPAAPLTVVFPAAEDGAPPAPDKTVPGLPSPPSSVAPRVEVRETHSLEHLPPLKLRITLPNGYPAEAPPVFELATSPSYIPAATLRALAEKGGSLWEEYGHGQTVFAYIDYLQQQAELAFELAGPGGSAALELPNTLEIELLDYDIAEKKRRFGQGTFDCGVCLEPKKGTVCYRLQRCGHVFCVACLQDFYNNCINEGDVTSVRCIDPTCGKEGSLRSDGPPARKRRRSGTLNPSELLQIPLERSAVLRYVELKRKKKLESDKSTVYCPRKWCQGPARSKRHPKATDPFAVDAYDSDSDDDNPSHQQDPPQANAEGKPTPAAVERLAICEDCTFAFCRVCLASWHGDYVRCWPRSEAELTAEEKASYDYIRTHTSPCPTCSSPCQKTHGCNHMNCFQCQTHFCYLCSSWLDPRNPYQHFNKKELGCYMRLWELEEGDEGQGNGGFVGARGWEAAALAAEEADAQERRQANAEADAEAAAEERMLQEQLEMLLLRPARGDNVVDEGLQAGLQNLAMDEAPQPHFQMPARRVQQRQLPARPGPQPAIGQPDRGHGLQRFLEMVQNDEEDGWDSDEMGDDDEFWIPER